MFGRNSRNQSAGQRIVRASECIVRPGIVQRTWLGELARSLVQLGQPYGVERAGWAAGLDSMSELDMVVEKTLRGSSMFLVSNAWVGDDAPGNESDGGVSDGGAHDGEEPAGMPTEPLGFPSDVPAGFPEPPRDREQLELYCEELGMQAINWIVAALEAPVLVPGEENEDVLARLALRSLSTLTVSYAFGSFEKDIVVDTLCGADVRERLDRLALRILELPLLAWWSEEFDPDNFCYHVNSGRGGARVTPAGSSIPSPRTNLLSREGRTVASNIRSIDKDFRDLPRVQEISWFPSSQFHGDASSSYRSTDPSWIVPSREELRVGLGELAADGSGAAVEERYLDERARLNSAVCTEQILGDDAGDRPLSGLVQQELPPCERHIWTIHTTREWTDLVIRFPMIIVPGQGPAENESWGGDARGTWVTVDWERASEEYDGIYLSVLGSLELAYVPLRVAIPGPRENENRECWTMMTGWTPGSVVWLKDPLDSWPDTPEWTFDDVEREYEAALARLIAESKGGGE